jgi:hypothetical protein
MPGYPFVLITTDLLQEGEDLHTFCSSVHHYGISWTPSAMEQRIGRIDRVRSQTDRRLSSLQGVAGGEDWLQVYFPYLQDTVEVLQVERVLDRMSNFLRLTHEGLRVPPAEQRRIDVPREMIATKKRLEASRDPLRSAFPIPMDATRGPKDALAVGVDLGARIRGRFEKLSSAPLGALVVQWGASPPRGSLLGTVTLPSGRTQPFTLILRSDDGHPVVRCVSPIGLTSPGEDPGEIVKRTTAVASRLGAIPTKEDRQYDLTVEDDVLLGDPAHDSTRVALLVRRVTAYADELEQQHYEDGRDAPMSTFERDLRKEAENGV